MGLWLAILYDTFSVHVGSIYAAPVNSVPVFIAFIAFIVNLIFNIICCHLLGDDG